MKTWAPDTISFFFWGGGGGETFSIVQNFKCVCSGSLCFVCGLICLNSWLIFMVLICGVVQS